MIQLYEDRPTFEASMVAMGWPLGFEHDAKAYTNPALQWAWVGWRMALYVQKAKELKA